MGEELSKNKNYYNNNNNNIIINLLEKDSFRRR